MHADLAPTGRRPHLASRPAPRCRACTAAFFAAAATAGSLATLIALGVPLRTAEEVLGVSAVVLLGLLRAVYTLHKSGHGGGGSGLNSSYSSAADW